MVLKEERKLRCHIHRHYIVATKYDRELSRLITDLVRATREDCAKQVEEGVHDTVNGKRIAAAIRKK